MSSHKYSHESPRSIRADLHIHTKASDGAYTPREVVAMARERGISVLAITDHDTVSGLAEAREAAREYGLQLISGIELSTVTQNKEIHILGYCIDQENEGLMSALGSLSAARDKRAGLIVDKLKDLGYPLTMAEVKAKAGSEIIGRPHIALAMMDHGIINNISEGFARFLNPGGLAYVPRYRISPHQAVEIISKAGGFAVLAHPGTDFSASLLPELIAGGLAGIEVYHPENPLQIRDFYLSKAAENGLLVTGGSDFHGHDQGDFQYFGRMPVPAGTVSRLLEGSPIIL